MKLGCYDKFRASGFSLIKCFLDLTAESRDSKFLLFLFAVKKSFAEEDAWRLLMKGEEDHFVETLI